VIGPRLSAWQLIALLAWTTWISKALYNRLISPVSELLSMTLQPRSSSNLKTSDSRS
jgi:hypothetical protein